MKILLEKMQKEISDIQEINLMPPDFQYELSLNEYYGVVVLEASTADQFSISLTIPENFKQYKESFVEAHKTVLMWYEEIKLIFPLEKGYSMNHEWLVEEEKKKRKGFLVDRSLCEKLKIIYAQGLDIEFRDEKVFINFTADFISKVKELKDKRVPLHKAVSPVVEALLKNTTLVQAQVLRTFFATDLYKKLSEEHKSLIVLRFLSFFIEKELPQLLQYALRGINEQNLINSACMWYSEEVIKLMLKEGEIYYSLSICQEISNTFLERKAYRSQETQKEFEKIEQSILKLFEDFPTWPDRFRGLQSKLKSIEKENNMLRQTNNSLEITIKSEKIWSNKLQTKLEEAKGLSQATLEILNKEKIKHKESLEEKTKKINELREKLFEFLELNKKLEVQNSVLLADNANIKVSLRQQNQAKKEGEKASEKLLALQKKCAEKERASIEWQGKRIYTPEKLAIKLKSCIEADGKGIEITLLQWFSSRSIECNDLAELKNQLATDLKKASSYIQEDIGLKSALQDIADNIIAIDTEVGFFAKLLEILQPIIAFFQPPPTPPQKLGRYVQQYVTNAIKPVFEK